MIATYPKTTTSVPVTLPLAVDLGGPARRQRTQVENLGELVFRLTLTLGGQSVSRRVWPGARYLAPCDLDSVTITPLDGDATYQVEAGR